MEYIFVVIAYISGSIPFAKIIAGMRGVDIQKVGSGNIGFANVERVMGLKYALPVLVGDIAKGLLPVVLARSNDLNSTTLSLVGAAAIIGHVFPVWLGFKGGKAIATSIGVATGLNILFGGVALVAYLILRKLLKNAALRSLGTIGCLVLIGFIISSPFKWFLVVNLLFVIWTHRNNLREIHAKREKHV